LSDLDYKVEVHGPSPHTQTIASFGSPVDADEFAARVSQQRPDVCYVVTDHRGYESVFRDGERMEIGPREENF